LQITSFGRTPCLNNLIIQLVNLKEQKQYFINCSNPYRFYCLMYEKI